ncbi:hypothetical protein [Micromonospora sp. NPDC047134]|uniref:hypothetical protein n=1 Tax=Micromonospora sp. NPDC047134 TaxID=3154340 RepID=UPI00340C6089
MASAHDDDPVVQAIVSAKRRLTDLKLEAMLRPEAPTLRIHDIDALADEVVAGLDGQRSALAEPARFSGM